MELVQYFSYVSQLVELLKNDLPELSEDKGSREQVEMCFKAYQDPYWEAEFE